MKSAKQKKKKYQRRRLQILWSWIRIVLIIVIGVSGGIWYVLSDHQKLYRYGHDVFVDSLKMCGFSLKNIKIYGRKITPSSEVLRAIDVYKNDGIFKRSLSDIQMSLSSLPWIKHVSVQRTLPWSLCISIDEREPIALFQEKKILFYIDKDGKKIEMEPYRSLLGVDFPVFLGDDACMHAATLLNELTSHPWISQHIRYYHFVRKRRWEFILKNGVKILLPEDHHDQALGILEKILKKAKNRIENIEKIDLRDTEKIIVKLKPGLTLTNQTVNM
jgi:cell division protein FtsQ